jgi:hypothetical protein
MPRLRTSILCAGLFFAGLLCGGLTRGIYDRNDEGRVNLMRVKCLHGLAEDFRRDNGRWPRDMPELKNWCERDVMERRLFGWTSLVSSEDVSHIPWILLSDPQSGQFNGFTSGRHSALRCEYGADSAGRVWMKASRADR